MALSSIQEAYLNYLVPPEDERGIPTKTEWIEHMFPDDGTQLHSHRRTLNRWEKLPEFQEELRRRREQYESGGNYADWVRRQAALDYQLAMLKEEDAKHHDKRQIAKDIVSQTKDAEKPGARVTFVDKSLPELVALMMGEHIGPRALTEHEHREFYEEVAEWESQQASPSD